MATYATVEDFEAYVEGWVTDDEDALERALERAERDIDRLLFHGIGVPESNGLRIVPGSLTTWAQEGLARATCAQAEYRMAKGDMFFVEKQLPGTSGDYSSPVAEPRYGPKVFEELRQSGIIRHSVRML